MPDLAQVTEHIRGAVGDNSGLGKTVKLDLGDGDGQLAVQGLPVGPALPRQDSRRPGGTVPSVSESMSRSSSSAGGIRSAHSSS